MYSSFTRRRRTRNDEENPQTIPLHELVKLIDKKTLEHYLELIIIFLKSSKRDLWFPAMKPQEEAFLVRVIKDEQNLRNLIDNFDSKSRHYAQEILQKIRQNEGVYCLTYCYCSSVINNGLLYKKVYYFDEASKDLVLVRRFLEDLQASKNGNSDETPDDTKKMIPPYKKIQWIDTMISFIDDDTKKCLEYPEMSFDESNYVYSLTRPRTSDVGDIANVRQLFVNLKTALDKLTESQVVLKSGFLYVADDIVRFSVQKVPINDNNNDNKRDLNKSKSSDANSDSHMTKAEKALERKKQLIDNLEWSFMKTTLKMILNFVNTAAEKSLVFSNANDDQCSFIQSACTMSKNPKLLAYFTEDCQDLLRSINKTMTANRLFEIKVEVAKARKNVKLRTVSIIKVLRECPYEKRFLKDDIETRPARSSMLGNKCSSLDRNRKSPKNNVTFQSGGTLEAEKNETAIDPDNAKATDESKPKTRPSRIDYQKPSTSKAEDDNNTENQDEKMSSTNNNNEHQIKKMILKRAQSVPAPTKDTSETDAEDKEVVDPKQSDGRKLCQRKIQLLKAMAIPMESDIAMRMMRQMGWEGGPLGVRGEGITEPIVPALHIANGAGLGHVRPENKNAAKKNNTLRLDFFQKFLGMIMEEKVKLIVEYRKALTKKEKSYFKRTVMSFCKRGRVPTDDEECKKVIDAITEKMLCKPNLSLTCEFSQDSKTLTIVDENDPSKQVELKAYPIFVDRNNINIQKCLESPDVITCDWTRQIAEYYYPIRMSRFSSTAVSVGHRIMVLYKILECFQSDDVQLVVKFAYLLTAKNCNFVKDVVQRINHRAIPSYSEGIESELGVLVLQYVKDTMLAVTFGNRSFTIEKMNAIPDANTKEPRALANNNNSTIDRNKPKDNKCKDKDSKLVTNKPTKVTVDTKESTTINAKATDSSVPKPLENISNKNVTCPKSNDVIKAADNTIDAQAKNTTKKVTDTLKENNKPKDAINGSDKTMRTQTLEKITEKDGESDETLDNDVKGEKSVKDFDTVAKKCIDNAVESKINVELQNKGSLTSAATKRMRSDSEQSEKDNTMKKLRFTITYLHISPKDSEKISYETIRKFQIAISDNIDLTAKLPLLECHGVENDVLVYSCHNQIATSLINSVASNMNLKTTDVSNEFKEIKRYKLKMKLNSFAGVNLKKLFATLEIYNAGLRTDSWAVVDVEVFMGYIVTVVDIDKESFQYILDANFSLFAGIDKLRFSNAWD